MNLAHPPEAIANNTYANRNGNGNGNGNESSGDGWRFRGRGLLQITGKNYQAAGSGLSLPLEAEPELLEQPEHAARSSAWWWAAHGLNGLADSGSFALITRTINGGMNGQDERVELWGAPRR